MTIHVNDQIQLTEFRTSDIDALVQHLNHRLIYDDTLRIPYPYTDADAEAWIKLAAKINAQQGCVVQWAIRTEDESLIGGCGLDDFRVGKSHRAEIGYWLAKTQWGRGIMTEVVQCVCRHAFATLGLNKISAHVFLHNHASARVLEKCGFQQEGFLRQHFFKDNKYWDARLYALLNTPNLEMSNVEA